jgi:hypothetical protein
MGLDLLNPISLLNTLLGVGGQATTTVKANPTTVVQTQVYVGRLDGFAKGQKLTR